MGKRIGSPGVVEMKRPIEKGCFPWIFGTRVSPRVRAGIDLIVMGSHGCSNLEAILVGGVSFEVVRKAYCPVTIVHRAPRRATASRETGSGLGSLAVAGRGTARGGIGGGSSPRKPGRPQPPRVDRPKRAR
jgi:Universal stress protein family